MLNDQSLNGWTRIMVLNATHLSTCQPKMNEPVVKILRKKLKLFTWGTSTRALDYPWTIYDKDLPSPSDSDGELGG